MKMKTIRAITSLLMLLAIVGCDAGGANDRARDSTTTTTTVTQVANYRDWGWEAIVLENGRVRLAAIPAIGGRIMEFSLDQHESIWRNEAALGTSPPPSGANWPNHGGFKNWPAPQSRWNWPPPPVLDYGPYEAAILHDSPDSVRIRLVSGVEEAGAPGLRFERVITLYAHSSRARIEQTLINETDQAQAWSVWDITQNLVRHAPAADFDNFRVYFPINPESRYGTSGVRVDKPSDAWVGEVASGVYEVKFRPDNTKLFADSRGGWIAYADVRDGYAYVKTFDVWPDAQYPDQGSDVEVYVSNQHYVEVEVLSPLTMVAANGGRYTFTEMWSAARTDGPVLHANMVGLVSQPLQFHSDESRVTGRFGVFHEGQAVLRVRDETGETVWASEPIRTSPSSLLEINHTIGQDAGAAQVELMVESENGGAIGVLASVQL